MSTPNQRREEHYFLRVILLLIIIPIIIIFSMTSWNDFHVSGSSETERGLSTASTTTNTIFFLLTAVPKLMLML